MVNNLRSIRRKRHLSQEELAQESGVHRVTIAKYETGRTEMSLKNLLKIAVVLGVSVDELIVAAIRAEYEKHPFPAGETGSSLRAGRK